jgi:hypothetical protein
MRSIACVAATCVAPPFSYRNCVNFASVLVQGQSPPVCRDCTDFVPTPGAGLSLIEPFVDVGRPENAAASPTAAGGTSAAGPRQLSRFSSPSAP